MRVHPAVLSDYTRAPAMSPATRSRLSPRLARRGSITTHRALMPGTGSAQTGMGFWPSAAAFAAPAATGLSPFDAPAAQSFWHELAQARRRSYVGDPVLTPPRRALPALECPGTLRSKCNPTSVPGDSAGATRKRIAPSRNREGSVVSDALHKFRRAERLDPEGSIREYAA